MEVTLSRAHVAGELLAEIIGDVHFANDLGPKMACFEVDQIAEALILLDQFDAAVDLLVGHAPHDDEGDKHHGWPLDERPPAVNYLTPALHNLEAGGRG